MANILDDNNNNENHVDLVQCIAIANNVYLVLFNEFALLFRGYVITNNIDLQW